MFSTLALLLGLMLLGLAVGQLAINIVYLRWLAQYDGPTPQDSALADGPIATTVIAEAPIDWPVAAVILCLRGGDHTLERCLNSLAQIQYPDFQIHIVLDNVDDPVRPLVEAWQARQSELTIQLHILTDISPYCYLKTSAIAQCVKSLDASVGVIAIVDADSIVYPNWLHDMVAPMRGGHVGLVTGNRWYDAQAANFGSTVRFLYNAWSVPIMFFMKAAWAGSLAVDRRVFGQEYFFQRMYRTSSEEFAMQESTRHAGLSAHVSGRVLMPQYDEISWLSCLRFMRRQLVWTRLYHPAWPVIMLAPLAIYLFFVLIFGLGCFRAWESNWGEAWVLWSLIIAYVLLNCCIIGRLHRSINAQIAVVQLRALPPLNWRSYFRLVWVTPLALVTFALATISAHLARRVAWRGIEYRICPPRDIEIIQYTPFRGG